MRFFRWLKRLWGYDRFFELRYRMRIPFVAYDLYLPLPKLDKMEHANICGITTLILLYYTGDKVSSFLVPNVMMLMYELYQNTKPSNFFSIKDVIANILGSTIICLFTK
jgi:hypothetical protein